MANESGSEVSLYELIGGEKGVEGVVFDFYKRVFADPELSAFFQNTDSERLLRMQREFFAAALDGPVEYSGSSLREAHAGRGIQPRHLKRYVDHLMETLAELGIDESARYDICSRINTYADEITGATSVDG
jgi:hemoglobin